MKISDIKKGKIEAPIRVLLYGPEKIGKSTFAANAPSPIFICGETGTEELDIARFPEPKSFNDVLACLNALVDDNDELPF